MLVLMCAVGGGGGGGGGSGTFIQDERAQYCTYHESASKLECRLDVMGQLVLVAAARSTRRELCREGGDTTKDMYVGIFKSRWQRSVTQDRTGQDAFKECGEREEREVHVHTYCTSSAVCDVCCLSQSGNRSVPASVPCLDGRTHRWTPRHARVHCISILCRYIQYLPAHKPHASNDT